MDPKTQVRPMPAWMLLAALAGVGTLFVDGITQAVLTVFVAVAAVAYVRNRYQAAKEAQR